VTALPIHLNPGTKEYRQANLVIFLAGFMAFAMLYIVQGILPALSHDFHISPATSSLTLSLTTLPMAIAIVVAATWSEGHGRRLLLIIALLGGAALTLLAAASPGFAVLLGLRFLTGVVLAGLPAVAMAYIAEEVAPISLGRAMGLYISGTGLGGMTGRLVGGLVSDVFSWRVALAALGLTCLVGGAWVARSLPQSRHFNAVPGSMRARLAAVRGPLSDPVIFRLGLCGFVLMGSLVSFFNYVQYRLAMPPFKIANGLVALIFLLYLFGTFSSNWMGRLTERRSSRSILLFGFAIMAVGALLTLPNVLPMVLLGTATIVFGFFGAHSVASGWVNARAREGRAQASSVYLFFFQLGSALFGFVGGLFFVAFGWSGEVGTVLVLLAAGVLIAIGLPSTKILVEVPNAS
jgi:YNFM family putative membrane transporter